MPLVQRAVVQAADRVDTIIGMKREGWLMRFSNWVKFDQRHELRHTQYPGVYAIAICPKNIAGDSFEWSEDIAYFGCTNAVGGLRSRLKAFNNTLRDLKGPGHGGAARFRGKHRDGDALAKRLYVAVCPFRCNVAASEPEDLLAMGEVVRAEYLALAEYKGRFRRLPKFNDKKKSPKRPKL